MTSSLPPGERSAEHSAGPEAGVELPQLTRGLRAKYERLFATCEIRAERLAATDATVDRLLAARGGYAELEAATGIPWYVPAVLHSLEAGLRFDRHLHNGDPLAARTVGVPAGRPRWRPRAVTWERSARDALKLKRFHRWEDWSVGGVLYKLEAYNGWGYRRDHPEVLSPYLWSFSTHYERGKYVVDLRFDPAAVSTQCGAAVLLHRMVVRGVIAFGRARPRRGRLRLRPA